MGRMSCDTGEDVGEPGLRIDAIHLRRDNKTVHGRGALPAAIGCAAGKDRTGVTIALLLSAIGVPSDIIVADYVLTGRAFSEPDPHDPHFVDWRASPVLLECPPDYMEAMLAHLANRHAGAGALLRRNGLSTTDLDRLIDLLTEPAPD